MLFLQKYQSRRISVVEGYLKIRWRTQYATQFLNVKTERTCVFEFNRLSQSFRK